MTLDPKIMTAVERLNYRVTVGDVAAQAGLEVNLAQKELLALASATSGNLQVSETGEIAYVIPPNFRAILRNKYFRLRLQEWWAGVWAVLFYLIRVSFGIVLVLSIVLILVTIAIILIAMSSSRDGDSRGRGSFGGGFAMPRLWIMPDLFWFFNPNPRGYARSHSHARGQSDPDGMNILEAIFSFLFGDGNPNADLEDRRWNYIGTVIRNNGGAVAAEQLAPYLDIADDHSNDDEYYALPVLTRFDGIPEVSDAGDIIYRFPELQSTAQAQYKQSVPAYLREMAWQFSKAKSGQIMIAIGLGSLNLVGALMLWSLLGDGSIATQIGGLVGFVYSIFGLLLGYGIGFLGVPLVRYFWIQQRNDGIAERNEKRKVYADEVNQADTKLQRKFNYAKQFAGQSVVSQQDLAYTTEKDLLEQESERQDAIDAEWQQRLNSSS